MPNIGPLELIIILVIALLILGPGKLPDVGSALGKSIREFRKAATDVQDSVKVDAAAGRRRGRSGPGRRSRPRPAAGRRAAPNTLAEPAAPNALVDARLAPAAARRPDRRRPLRTPPSRSPPARSAGLTAPAALSRHGRRRHRPRRRGRRSCRSRRPTRAARRRDARARRRRPTARSCRSSTTSASSARGSRSRSSRSPSAPSSGSSFGPQIIAVLKAAATATRRSCCSAPGEAFFITLKIAIVDRDRPRDAGDPLPGLARSSRPA